MWDTALVLVIVAVCAVLLGRKFYRQITGKNSCGCSCSGGSCQTGKPPQSSCGCPPPEEKK